MFQRFAWVWLLLWVLFLLSSGTKGKRIALPNDSSILIHQPLIGGHGLTGQTTDIEIAAKNLVRTKERLNRILAENCGKTVEKSLQEIRTEIIGLQLMKLLLMALLIK